MMKVFLTILSFWVVFMLSGCGGGEDIASATPTKSNAKISGAVVDAPVSGSTVYVYSDASYQTLIGKGTTTSSGAFNLTLDVTTAPDPIYIKTVGGVNTDDGMSAPEMAFVGSVYSDGKYYITPLTNQVWLRMLAGDNLPAAQSAAQAHLGIGQSALYGNPLSNSDSNRTVNSLIQSGTSEVKITDGTYNVSLLPFDDTDIGKPLADINSVGSKVLDMNVTVNDGNISGVMSGATRVSGSISGSTMLLTILMDNAHNNAQIKVAGSVGMFGSVTGTYTFAVSGGLHKGIFAGEFMPSSSINPVGLANKLAKFGQGYKNFIYKEYIGDNPGVGFGDLNVTGVDANLSITTSDMTVTYEQNTTSSVNFTMTKGSDSKIYKKTSGIPTSMALMSFTKPNAIGGGKVFIIQAVGVRGSIFVETNSSNNIIGMGDAILNKRGTFAPNFKANKVYKTTVYAESIGLLNQDRNQLIPRVFDMNTTGMPDLNTTFHVLASNQRMIFGGGNVIMYKDDNGNDLNDTVDYIRSFQMFDTGAFYGENIGGGVISATDFVRNYPATFVGRTVLSGYTPQPYKGTLNFISRVLYSATGYANYLDYTKGTIEIDGSDANFVVTGVGSFTLTADFNSTSGIYHIYGQPSGNTGRYMDIFWPVGSTKAVYTTTYDTNTSIKEIGEAYLSE